jgi:hypothetical protein
MNDLNIEIQIDCSPQSRPQRPKLDKTAEPSASIRRAPVALTQRPVPPPDEWDQPGGRVVEFGSVDELRAQLVAQLEEALARAKGEWNECSWDAKSKTWPWTRIGGLLLDGIRIAQAISNSVTNDN